MHSFLITARDKNKASSYISDFLAEKEIYPIDIDQQIFEKPMGIEDVRNIQKKILLKPFRGKTKAVIIDAYENITPQAQNALLKILEEPPANTIIVITTAKRELILPTIISRCKVIILREKEIKLTEEDLSKFHDTLNILLNGKIGDKLKIAEVITRNKSSTDSVRDKEDAVLWLEKMSIFVRNKLTQDSNDLKYLNFLKELQKTYKAIKSTNVNQRIALENFFLSL